MRIRHALALLVAGCALATAPGAAKGQSEGSPFVNGVTVESSPAPDGSAQPSLSVDRTGRVRLSWLARREGGGHRFQLAEYQGSGWSVPATIAEGDKFLANWADVPSIFSTSSDAIVAHWLELGEARGSYGIRVSQSADAGKTWSAPQTPHRDGTASEHGFVSFFEGPGSTVGLVWLDGRLTAERGRAGSMSLRATTMEAGKPTEDVLVDAKVCDCCPTAAARSDAGVIVVYRDRSDSEVRDISVARLVGGKWTPPSTVFEDKWQINACPVNGPVVAAAGRAAAVAWFTVAGGTARVKVAFSSDAGETFSPPAVVESEATFGRLGIAMLDADRALVSSIEKVGGADQIVVREAKRGGRVGPPMTVAATTFERTSGFPRMAVSGRRVWFAWTDVTSGPVPKVRVASARLR